MTQGLLKSFLFTVVGENWNLRGISYSMSYPFMCSLMVVVRSVHPRRPRGCESIQVRAGEPLGINNTGKQLSFIHFAVLKHTKGL